MGDVVAHYPVIFGMDMNTTPTGTAQMGKTPAIKIDSCYEKMTGLMQFVSAYSMSQFMEKDGIEADCTWKVDALHEPEWTTLKNRLTKGTFEDDDNNYVKRTIDYIFVRD